MPSKIKNAAKKLFLLTEATFTVDSVTVGAWIFALLLLIPKTAVFVAISTFVTAGDGFKVGVGVDLSVGFSVTVGVGVSVDDSVGSGVGVGVGVGKLTLISKPLLASE